MLVFPEGTLHHTTHHLQAKLSHTPHMKTAVSRHTTHPLEAAENSTHTPVHAATNPPPPNEKKGFVLEVNVPFRPPISINKHRRDFPYIFVFGMQLHHLSISGDLRRAAVKSTYHIIFECLLFIIV
ncbi:PREDICTED: uncharacterized protein LOC108970247 [Bactrocera latifrons]|uniref:uncharacterized protein LOC108970247 n=1 Tax=Bactrocera latifrons TaxID=174628 RepID=UPI0008DCBE39|nr:PREDICTED: uncharacterized protein LOC108970247 [Bactrocera latifrons]